MANKIEHLVVLMMENRSFDHMFGLMKSSSYLIDGLDGTETNPDSAGTLVKVSNDARFAGDLKDDPSHSFVSVNEQIFGNSQATGNGPFMQGFVKNYQTKTNNLNRSHNIMKCFDEKRIPVLTTLAREYAVCDHWHASVPGPTLPNRAFAFGATSQGRVDMAPQYFSLKTIFELLNEQGVSSRIYFPDWSLGFVISHIIKNTSKYLRTFEDFLSDCKKNKLPAYSFIEPRFNDYTNRGEFFPANDQHPDHDVFEGEKVISSVYQAVTSNRQTWESTLLLITYDEHGGLYDHVTPPPTQNPDGKVSFAPPFDFTRLGVRVPAVLVSPYIPRGTILHEVFDHTSQIATARKLFLKDFENHFLTERDRNAKTFEGCLNLSTPRTDKVTFPKAQNPSVARSMATRAARSAEAVPATKTAARPLSDFQEAMVIQAFALESTLPPEEHTSQSVGAIKTEQQAAEYLAHIKAKIVESTNGTKAKRTGSKTGKSKAAKGKAGKSKAVKTKAAQTKVAKKAKAASRPASKKQGRK